MTSMGNRGDAHYYTDIGITAYLDKPTIVQDLHDALVLIMIGCETQPATKTLLTRHDLPPYAITVVMRPRNISWHNAQTSAPS